MYPLGKGKTSLDMSVNEEPPKRRKPEGCRSVDLAAPPLTQHYQIMMLERRKKILIIAITKPASSESP